MSFMNPVPGPRRGPIPDPIKQVFYRSCPKFVLESSDGGRSIVLDTPTEQIVIPMPADEAERMGKALSAPSVVLPQNGDPRG